MNYISGKSSFFDDVFQFANIVSRPGDGDALVAVKAVPPRVPVGAQAENVSRDRVLAQQQQHPVQVEVLVGVERAVRGDGQRGERDDETGGTQHPDPGLAAQPVRGPAKQEQRWKLMHTQNDWISTTSTA